MVGIPRKIMGESTGHGDFSCLKTVGWIACWHEITTAPVLQTALRAGGREAKAPRAILRLVLSREGG
jgi:hypothetical protein